MAPKLYKMDMSPPARTAMMACDVFKVNVEMIEINLLAGDHYDPEYLKKNPLHTVPVYEDGDFILHDSHAILIYLAEAYGKNGDLYPKDIKQRALINQMLFFDIGTCFTRLFAISYLAFIEGKSTVTQTHLDRIEEAYGYVEQFLTRTKFIAADHLTIADISVVSIVTSMAQVLPWNTEKYPKIDAWVKVMEKYDFYQKYNATGVKNYGIELRKRLEFEGPSPKAVN